MTSIKPATTDIDLTAVRIKAVETATEAIAETIGTAIEEAASEALKNAVKNATTAYLSTMYGKLELVFGVYLGGEDHVSWEIDLADEGLLVDPEHPEYREEVASKLEAIAKSIREG